MKAIEIQPVDLDIRKLGYTSVFLGGVEKID